MATQKRFSIEWRGYNSELLTKFSNPCVWVEGTCYMLNVRMAESAKRDPNGTVFISYRRDDGTICANKIGALLRAAGLRVWRDIYNMPAAKTQETLERVLGKETSAGVIIVTPNTGRSDMMINLEVPILLNLANDPDFPLAIANTVQKLEGGIDHDAPDRSLKIDTKTLSGINQFSALDKDGINKLVSEMLNSRIRYIVKRMESTGADTITINVETRMPAITDEQCKGDLQIRINPDKENPGRLSKQGLEDLKEMLPLVSNTLQAQAEDKKIQITGRMHLTPALAIGAAFPGTKFKEIEIVDRDDNIWCSKREISSPKDAVEVFISRPTGGNDDVQNQVAVLISMAPRCDKSLFDKMVKDGKFDKVIVISTTYDQIDHRWAGELSREIIRKLGNVIGDSRPLMHLAYHGPAALAILLGRLLNTYKVIAYERTEEQYGNPIPKDVYSRTLLINVGYPIQAVYNSDELGDDGVQRSES